MFKAAFHLFSGSLLGKMIGVLRELLMASIFGTGSAIGAFRIAQTAVIVLIHFFTAESLNAGFIPLYMQYKKRDPQKAENLFRSLQSVLLLFSLIVVVTLVIGAKQIVLLIAPGFELETTQIAVRLVRILALSVPLYTFGALFSNLEMANGTYMLISMRASIHSFGLIVGAAIAYLTGQIEMLAWGFTIAYAVFVSWGAMLLSRRRLLSPPVFRLSPETRQVLCDLWRNIRPLLLIPVLLQGSFVVERAVASLMGVAAVPAWDYAIFITETGNVFLAVPLGLAALSTFGELSDADMKKRLQHIIPLVLVATIPISGFLALYSHQIIQVIYQRGAFDANSTSITQSMLLGLSIGFWAQVVGYVLIKVLNAQLRNGEVIRYMSIALILKVITITALFRIVGPISLGLGISIYGLALFILSIRAVGLVRRVLVPMVWLFLGTIVHAPIALWFARDGWQGLLIGGITWAIFWFFYIHLVPTLRANTALIRNRLLNKTV